MQNAALGTVSLDFPRVLQDAVVVVSGGIRFQTYRKIVFTFQKSADENSFFSFRYTKSSVTFGHDRNTRRSLIVFSLRTE